MVLALGLVVSTAACARMTQAEYDLKSSMGSVSMGERCVHFMRRAFPGGDIGVTARHVTTTIDTVTVDISGVRRNEPANGPYARGVGVECLFKGGILTSFRWTKGPVSRSNSDTGSAR